MMTDRPGRYLGLDYGSRTVGVAVSDPLGLTAQALETIWRKDENHLRSTFRRIEELISEYDITGIVLGNPIHMDGSAGERSEKTKEFGKLLIKRTGLPVYMSDERLTSIEATDILSSMGIRKSEMKRYIDKTAAALILTEWMNNNGNADIL